MDALMAAYVSVTAVLVLTPGSTTTVVVRQALMGGRAAGLAAALGAAAGNTSHALAAGLGLAIVFARWPAALAALRVGGSLYLVWLGLRSLLRAAREADGGLRLGPGRGQSVPWRTATFDTGSFRAGLLVNLLNPAIATFYLVVVPAFLPHDAPSWYFGVLAALHVSMALVCHGLWAIALDGFRTLLGPPLARRALEAVAGCALIGLGVRVLLT